MRCSRRAGFHGGSKLITAEAARRFSPTPPASVERNTLHSASRRNFSMRAPRFREGTPPCRETNPIPSLFSSSPARWVMRSYSLKTATLRPSSITNSMTPTGFATCLAVVSSIRNQKSAKQANEHQNNEHETGDQKEDTLAHPCQGDRKRGA